MVLLFLVGPFVVACYSHRYAFIVFTLLPVELLLGSVVGFFAFDWIPSICQHLLTLSAIIASGYAWSQREYFDF